MAELRQRLTTSSGSGTPMVPQHNNNYNNKEAETESEVMAEIAAKSSIAARVKQKTDQKAAQTFLCRTYEQIAFGASFGLLLLFSLTWPQDLGVGSVTVLSHATKTRWLDQISHLVTGQSHAAQWGDKIYHTARLFVDVQYETTSGQAHSGWKDAAYLFTAFVGVLTARALIQLVSYVSVLSRTDLTVKAKIRFTEQAWCLLYYTGAGVWGLVLLRSQEYGWHAETLWRGFPHYLIDSRVKRYYLTLFGYWLTQLVVINLEERRKDHWQMFTHHIVTCCLVWGSLAYSYTRIGHLVLIMMDTVDVFLSLAKCTKYLRFPGWVTDGVFLVFLVSWVGLRHVLYLYEVLYAAFKAPAYLNGRCTYLPGKLEPVQCFSPFMHNVFFGLTMSLQVIVVMWLVMILKIVVRIIRGDGAADTRSDSED